VDFVRDGRLHSRMAVVRGVEMALRRASAAAGRLTASDRYGRVIAEFHLARDACDGYRSGDTRGRYLVTSLGDSFARVCMAALALLLWRATLANSSRALTNKAEEPRDPNHHLLDCADRGRGHPGYQVKQVGGGASPSPSRVWQKAHQGRPGRVDLEPAGQGRHDRRSAGQLRKERLALDQFATAGFEKAALPVQRSVRA
jgi:hypothetical protein